MSKTIPGTNPPYYVAKLFDPNGVPVLVEGCHMVAPDGEHFLAFARPLVIDKPGRWTFRIETEFRSCAGIWYVVHSEPWTVDLPRTYELKGLHFRPPAS